MQKSQPRIEEGVARLFRRLGSRFENLGKGRKLKTRRQADVELGHDSGRHAESKKADKKPSLAGGADRRVRQGGRPHAEANADAEPEASHVIGSWMRRRRAARDRSRPRRRRPRPVLGLLCSDRTGDQLARALVLFPAGLGQAADGLEQKGERAHGRICWCFFLDEGNGFTPWPWPIGPGHQ